MGPKARTVKVPGGHQRQEETGCCGASLRSAEKRRHCRQIMSPLALLWDKLEQYRRQDMCAFDTRFQGQIARRTISGHISEQLLK
jgi:hypothetical protein